MTNKEITMNDIISALNNQFLPKNRFSVFGNILLELNIEGIKGTNCTLSFDFPVTAIAGYNGAGKSTIAQIALCMYRAVDGEEAVKRKYLKDFFVKTLLDRSPYDPKAKIVAKYASIKETKTDSQISFFDNDPNGESTKTITVYYSVERWEGYRYQPQRNVYYYGMSYFIPYQEQSSHLLRDSNANIANYSSFDEKIVSIASDILSIRYTSLRNNNISNEKRAENVISASKSKASYSENHMGCGEGRLLKLVHALETAPNQSLFVIEEPETALHQNAQYKLAQYFLDVCNRKKHQIIFTTHSSEIQRALPPQARKYIQRDEVHTLVMSSPSMAEIENYLSGGKVKKMIIVTEDQIGQMYIKEIMRAYCPLVFQNCDYFAMNLGYEEIKTYVRHSQNCGIKIFGVVDEHRRADIQNHILAFPSEISPECSIFQDELTKEAIEKEFGFDCADLKGDHHNYFGIIARQRNEDEEYVKNRCLKLFVQNKGSQYYDEITQTMKAWLSECNN